jgi:hypothetical protein
LAFIDRVDPEPLHCERVSSSEHRLRRQAPMSVGGS